MKPTRSLVAAFAATALLVTGTVASHAAGAGAGTSTSASASNPFQRGPDPTPQSIDAELGPFKVDKAAVPPGQGFGGGTVHFPTDTSQGTFGAVAVSPGFMSPEFMISWYGPRLASQGFVVLTMSTNTPADTPSMRADQLLAALKYVVEQSPAKSRVDGSRLAVMGHSMGGGGSLEAAIKNPALKATIPLEPWHLFTDFTKVRTPSLVIGGQLDFIAPAGAMAKPFHDSIPAGVKKGYIELAGASHFEPIAPNVTIARYSISWLKRFVDNDTRFEQFLCPVPKDPKASVFLVTCPLG
ncbi:dienelactone hydrolase [Herbihabitans rhizosphaerae]|uniref:Dienelactone hydrolase n=1 Tax=Herbihabitans rhizosphaerae TaxID=1872711 RepID=A0A4Q7L413_9PSEU|nr:dienelactone hydrolase family protein [Herbihabitans rhizosphaerae]RZS43211.1 dienelactone hydrolase [Herbihabitans rhizosphaerae]